MRSASANYQKIGAPYGIPASTLHDYHLRSLSSIASASRSSIVSSTRSGGHQRLLSDDVERKLKKWIDDCGDVNQPPSVDFIRLKAKRLHFATHTIPITDENRQQMASLRWWRGYKKRFPTLSARNIQPLQFARAKATQPEIINHFYDLLKYQLDTYKFTPDQIYAADETRVAGDVKPGKGVGDRGKKLQQVVLSVRGHVSMMHICNANGFSLPPLYVFSGVKLKYNMLEGSPADSAMTLQEHGSFTGATFSDVIRHIIMHTQPGQKLLIIDGNNSHHDVDGLQLCVEHNVHVLNLPSHATHLLQVADISVFGPFKRHLRSAEAARQHDDTGVVKTQHVAALTRTSWEKSTSRSHVIAGFEKAGIVPFNREKTTAKIYKQGVLHRKVHDDSSPYAPPPVPHVPSSTSDPSFSSSPPSSSPPPVVETVSSILSPPNPIPHPPPSKRQHSNIPTTYAVMLTEQQTIDMVRERQEAKEEKKRRKAEKKRKREEKKAHAALQPPKKKRKQKSTGVRLSNIISNKENIPPTSSDKVIDPYDFTDE